MKKKIIAIIILSGLISTLWANEKNILKMDELVQRISAVERSHIYSDMKNQIINSEKELLTFLEESEKKYGKNYFSKILKNEKIDFTKYNLMIYLHTETSGSVQVSVNKPYLDKDNNVIIPIDGKSDFGMQTDDMAYYGFIYKVAKSIKKVTFDNFLDGVTMKAPSTIEEIGFYAKLNNDK